MSKTELTEQLLRSKDAAGYSYDKQKLQKMKLKTELYEEQNNTGLQKWANQMGRLKAGKPLPF